MEPSQSLKLTVKKICRVVRDEKEVREVLEAIRKNAEKTEETLVEVADKNEEVYQFEKILEVRK
jgi:predicted Zn-ribbon and HTH transcriptional regulator